MLLEKKLKLKEALKKPAGTQLKEQLIAAITCAKKKKFYTIFFATDISISRIFSSLAIKIFSRLKRPNELNARKLNEHLSFFIHIHVFRARISGQINVAFFPK